MQFLNTTVVTSSVSRLAGGLFTSVRRLHQTISQVPGVNIRVFAPHDKFTDTDKSLWKPLTVETFPVCVLRQLGYSPGLRRAILASAADLAHTHGIWMYPSAAVSYWHRRTGKPYLVSPHGMLDAWAVRNSAWKKKLALSLYEREHLESAACLRALCESEARAIRVFGLKNPIAIVPNGIDIPEAGSQKSEVRNAPWAGLVEPEQKVLLFLSRIHPKKGLVNLLKAWTQIRKAESGRRKADDWILAIAGWGQGGHEAELKTLAEELRIPWADLREHRTPNIQHPTSSSNPTLEIIPSSTLHPPSSLLFLGPQFSGDKAACYANCDAFILPSFSEGLPMAVLEAWAFGRPVLMTPECNLPEGFAANAAIRIEPNVEGILRGLRELFRTPDSVLRTLGDNGRQLAAGKFAWPKIAGQMKSVYEWVLGGGSRPDCVVPPE